MIVVPVDDRDVGGDARERLRGEQAAEAGADDDDARTTHALLPAVEIAVRACVFLDRALLADYI